MGFKCSWIAFFDAEKDDILRATSLTDAGEPDEYREGPFSGAALQHCYLLYANDFEFADPKRLAVLSRGRRLLACQIYEVVMAFTAYGYENGVQTWFVVHNGSSAIRDLHVGGSLPSGYEAIRARCFEQQEVEDAETGGEVDFISEIPVELAKALCGFRHDEPEHPEAPKFTRLEPIKRGWRLFN